MLHKLCFLMLCIVPDRPEPKTIPIPKQVKETPIVYEFTQEDGETYKITLNKKFVHFENNNGWEGSGFLEVGTNLYRVQWYLNGQLWCVGSYERKGNNLIGSYLIVENNDLFDDEYHEGQVVGPDH